MNTPLKSTITVLLLLLTASLFAQNNALHFDGVDDFVTLPISIPTSYGFVSSGTWEAWVQKENWADHHDDRLFSNGIYLENEGAIYVSLHPAVGLHLRFGGTQQPGNVYAASGLTKDFAPNSWHHLAATWSFAKPSVIKLYIDGIEVAKSEYILNIKSTTPSFIGGDSVGAKFGPGAMDAVSIWKITKSANEIAADYLAGRSEIKYPQAGMIAYCNFNNSNAGSANSNTLADLITPKNSIKLNNFALDGSKSNYITSTIPVFDNDNTNQLLGEIRMYAGNTAPSGWEMCNGSELPVASYLPLFSVIGFKYGGDGAKMFKLPDLLPATTGSTLKTNYIICSKAK